MDLLRRDVTMQISRGWAVLTPCCQRKQISLHLLCFKSVFSCFTFKQAKSFEFLFIIFIYPTPLSHFNHLDKPIIICIIDELKAGI